MNYLTADEAMIDRLRGVVEPVEIRDFSGKVLGQYTPAISPELSAMYEKAKKLFDLDEAKRVAATEHHGYSIQEVMQHLHSLEKGG